MGRKLIHALLVLLLGTVPMVLGIMVALGGTGAGRALVARSLSVFLDRITRGDVNVGAVSGSFLFGVNLDRVVIRDTSGALLLDAPRIEVGYSIPNFLANRIILSGLHLIHPTIHIIKHRSGRINYEEIFKLGEKQGTGASPLIELRNFRMDSATVRIYLPYNFKAGITTEDDRAVALAQERARPGRIIEDGPEGLRKVFKADAVTARFPVLRISSPDKKPLEIEVDTLAMLFNDPGITLTDFAGRVRIQNDSATIAVVRGGFPHSGFQGGGVLTWPDGNLMFDLALEVPRLDLRDLHWISPDFPNMQGSANLAAISESPTRTDYVLDHLVLHRGVSVIEGNVTAVVDTRRGLGVRDMDLRLRDVNLDIARPYLDTVPLDGTLSGKIAGNGFLDTLDLNMDVTFNDARVEGRPPSYVTGDGTMHLGGHDGPVFDNFLITKSDFDLRTVNLIAPAVRLHGRAALAGSLDGPWKNVVFHGRAEHRDGERGLSAVEGMVKLDTRSQVLGLDSDIELDPIDFEGLRGSFPGLTVQGMLHGHLKTQGDLSHLAIDANVRGDLGAAQAVGAVILQPPRLGADSLDLHFQDIDLAKINGRGLSTRLQGHGLVSILSDTLAAPVGTMQLTLDSSRIREFQLDSARADLAIADSVIHLDTLEVQWGNEENGGRVSGSGTLGWVRPHSGTITLSATAASLAPFDSLVVQVSGARRDSTLPSDSAAQVPAAEQQVRLGGSAQADITLSGSLDTLLVKGLATVEDFRYQNIGTPGATATFEWTGGHRARTAIGLSSDSIRVGVQGFNNVNVAVEGWTDSLSWAGSLDYGTMVGMSGGGRWWKRRGAWVLSLDTLTAKLPVHTWRLVRPADIAIGDSVIAFTTLGLETTDHAGSLEMNGELPRNGTGTLNISGKGISLTDVYSLMGKDTTGIAGALALDVELTGTAAAPTISGTGTAGDLVLGDFRAPFVQGVFDYRNHLLDANLLLWRTGVNVLRVEARLPLDLALAKVKRRQLPGELSIRAQADSVDLALLEAFTPNVRKVTGLLKTDVEVTGTWEAPRMAGFLEVIGGGVTLPSLGVRYGNMNGRFAFSGDSISVPRFRITSGDGDLILSGTIRLPRLTSPELNLTLDATNFLAINNPTFLTLEASGKGNLVGPVYGAELTGNIVANSGVLHFADLLTKRIVNLSDPEVQGLVDTSLIRTQNLGAAFESVFLDSLR
ncbi:MAG: translocation/assembly module TamB domain-containing protein, partial [Gemmatimonadota bacterium]